ncbi:MAG TPA: aminotransferase class V-fold PLP-dependent enzyme [Polyangia bacterium]|nr:aminotransferase class V-fold PLP-dependent enzyme [Polyangia bacterium]
MIRQALLLAAGRGRPVADPEIPNCLATVGGVPLIQRSLRVLAAAGIRRVGIVVGWKGDLLRKRVEELCASVRGLPQEISFHDNPLWQAPNGLSVLAARRFLAERTLLLMADQIATPRLVATLARLPAREEVTLLGIDRDLSRVFDFDDATKVRLSTGADGLRVQGIGKQLREHDAVSTSLFAMSPTLLEALDALEQPSLTEGVAEAARRGLVIGHDVAGAVWQDVDSAEMRLHAEWLLRVYGDELDRPAMRGVPRSPATDTLALIEQLLTEKDAERFTLFNPGPVMTSTRVKSALVHHDVCHRDLDFTGVVRRLRTKLGPVFGAGAGHEILVLTGSGTAAMEMALTSVVPPGRAILTIENGAFGERLGEIAELHGIPHVTLRRPWGSLVEPADVEAALERDPRIAAVAMIHHETSVGIMNPVAAVGRICRARGVTSVVDAVSSLGVEDLDVVRDQIDVCFSSANKCLHSVSGVSFVCVAPEVWPRIEATPPRVYYLDLLRYRRYFVELEQTPFTPAVSAFFALETALDELSEQGGVPARREIYRRRNLLIRRVLTDLGFHSFTNTGRESHTIVTMRVPSFITVEALYDALKQRGYIVYRCKGELAADHLQIANMGELPDATIDNFLAAVADVVAAARAAAGTAERARLRSV